MIYRAYIYNVLSSRRTWDTYLLYDTLASCTYMYVYMMPIDSEIYIDMCIYAYILYTYATT